MNACAAQAPLRDAVTAYVALGANLGMALQTVQQAFDSLARLPVTQVLAKSKLYRTAPFEASGPDFINAVAKISTGLTAPDLLAALQAIENQAGRQRPYANAPRTLDLDLLIHGQSLMSSPRLTLPHPRWRERAFVVYPLADVSHDFVGADEWARVAGQAIEALPDTRP